MPDARMSTRYALYALFTLSGFAGLIYESIWSHYLKLFLGHAAYAQTLVLMIFMGGMALGAWIAGEWSQRVQRPLVAYAVVEAILGVFALSFDWVFRGLQGWAFDSAIPALESAAAIETLKWGLSALVILPQSVLLGMTFPLMSAGVLRVSQGLTGRVLAWLYFTNSLGASAGVLVSGFVLVAWVGLPGTMLTAGLVNFLLVLGVWLIARQLDAQPPVARAVGGSAPARGLALLLATALLTGAASFFYEIGWIRMLSLVLGSATHSFELMLSAFILGLALGSFIIRGRIETLRDPLATLGMVQVVMALLALGTLLLYPQTFDWMATLRGALARTEASYVAYVLMSHAICLVLMLPVTICAGMTLPLITHLLIKRGHGEAAIGRVYAANTVGAISGVLLAVHGVMPLMGLRQVVVVGASIDLALGLVLLRLASAALVPAARWALGGAVLISVAIATSAPFDPARLASGVFRNGVARNAEPILFHQDGKTATISVFGKDDYFAIATNGKVDAGLRTAAPPSTDDYTMILLGVLPALIHPEPRTVAAIGFGSGRTTHTLLQDPRLTRVDTIEIEPAMVEGAKRFGPLVSSAFDDPRSVIHIEDAKTFFARGGERYDIVVSEPSNPWVSGTASLFSREFYHHARRHLAEGGVLLQWLQLYETDVAIVGSVLKALGSEFEDYVLYTMGTADMLIVASAHGKVPAPAWREVPVAGFGPLLASLNIRGPQDLDALRIGDRALVEPWVRTLPLPANSDYFPVVDQNAARYVFVDRNAMSLQDVRGIELRLSAHERENIGLTLGSEPLFLAQAVARAYGVGRKGPAEDDTIASGPLLVLRALPQACESAALAEVWLVQFQDVAPRLIPYIGAAGGKAVAAGLRKAPCYPGLSRDIHAWVDLLEFGSAADPRARDVALKLLEAYGPANALAPFLLGEALLITLRQNDRSLEEARKWAPQLWQWGGKSPALTLLMAHLAVRG
ncbi:MAG TPA: spermidine synthase [Verrucomicrobiae bacterium]|nr:spermidine synthase [Verrucomicrobiae bacterium]